MTIKSLDGLRGLAVLLVVLSHFSLSGINLLPFLDFAGVGKAGVYLFFVLSAFLLTWQAMESSDGRMTSFKYWLGYLFRRVCRIYPLYIVVLLSAFLITTQTARYGPKVSDLNELLLHIVLLQGNNIYWAIPVEFKFYFILPVVALALYAISKTHIASVIIVVAALFVGVLYLWPASAFPANTISLLPYLGIFIAGCGIAFLATDPLVSRVLSRIWVVDLIGWLAIAAALITVPSVWRLLVDPNAPNQVFHNAYVLYACIWGLAVLVAVNQQHSWFRQFFELSAWRFLGRISFSIYLWHFPIVQFIAKEIPTHTLVQFILASIVTLLLSYLTYRFIERPFIQWGHTTTAEMR